MLKQNKRIKCFDWLLMMLMALFISPVWAAGLGTINGQVLDTNGKPIAGVTVTTKDAASVVTNPGGVFTLTGVKQKSRILVDFVKAGYTPSQGTASLVSGATNVTTTNAEEGGTKLLKATLIKTLLKSGAKQTVNSVAGGALTQSGFKVTFPANSFTVNGSVDVVVSPVIGATNQIKAAPGNFTGVTLSGQTVSLKSYAMADISLTQNGQPVNLKKGASANIELLLPLGTTLAVGAVKPMWSFDTIKGMWQEEGTGMVRASTTIPGRLAVFATVKHFCWWSSFDSVITTAITGRVVDKNGVPVPGAFVDGSTPNFSGAWHATADASGNYCIEIEIDTNGILAGFQNFNSIMIVSDLLRIATAATPSSCAGANQVADDLVIPLGLSCVNGEVRDVNDLPVSGAVVFSSTGGFVTTDGIGAYQILVPENTSIKVYALGYPAVAVTTPSAGASCAVANIRASTVSATTSCLTGPFGLPGYLISAYDPISNSTIANTITGADGLYCIEGLPADSYVNIGVPGYTQPIYTPTGSGGGSCATNTCNAGPPIGVPG